MTGIPLNLEFQKSGQVCQPDLDVEYPGWQRISQGIRDGDPLDFQRFYNHFFQRIYQQIRRTTGRDEATCLDILQEVMVKVIRGIPVIDDADRMAAWVSVVTRTTTYDWLRRELRAGRYDERQPTDTSADGHCAPPERLDDRARVLWLEQQLNSLPHSTRRMIALRYRLGWTLKQVAQHFGLKTGAVDGRIRRALNCLQQQAKQEFPDEL